MFLNGDKKMKEISKKDKIKKSIIKLLFSILVLGLLFLGLYFLLRHFGLTNLTQEQLQELIKKTGAWGPIAYILISFLQVTFVPIPGAVTIIAGSYLFGVWGSFFYSLIGMMLGAMFAFLLGKWLGRKFVNWIVGDSQTVEKYLERTKGKEVVIFFFMFLLPMFPDDALCTVAGITCISFPLFVGMQLITRPIAIAGTLFFMSGQIIPYDQPWGIAIIVLVVIVSIVAFIYSYKNSDKINDWLNKLASKFKRKKD